MAIYNQFFNFNYLMLHFTHIVAKSAPLHALIVADRSDQALQWIANHTVEEISAADETFGLTPLHIACIYGRLDIIQALFEREVRGQERDRDGLTPLQAGLLYQTHRELMAKGTGKRGLELIKSASDLTYLQLNAKNHFEMRAFDDLPGSDWARQFGAFTPDDVKPLEHYAVVIRHFAQNYFLGDPKEFQSFGAMRANRLAMDMIRGRFQNEDLENFITLKLPASSRIGFRVMVELLDVDLSLPGDFDQQTQNWLRTHIHRLSSGELYTKAFCEEYREDLKELNGFEDERVSAYRAIFENLIEQDRLHVVHLTTDLMHRGEERSLEQHRNALQREIDIVLQWILSTGNFDEAKLSHLFSQLTDPQDFEAAYQTLINLLKTPVNNEILQAMSSIHLYLVSELRRDCLHFLKRVAEGNLWLISSNNPPQLQSLINNLFKNLWPALLNPEQLTPEAELRHQALYCEHILKIAYGKIDPNSDLLTSHQLNEIADRLPVTFDDRERELIQECSDFFKTSTKQTFNPEQLLKRQVELEGIFRKIFGDHLFRMSFRLIPRKAQQAPSSLDLVKSLSSSCTALSTAKKNLKALQGESASQKEKRSTRLQEELGRMYSARESIEVLMEELSELYSPKKVEELSLNIAQLANQAICSIAYFLPIAGSQKGRHIIFDTVNTRPRYYDHDVGSNFSMISNLDLKLTSEEIESLRDLGNIVGDSRYGNTKYSPLYQKVKELKGGNHEELLAEIYPSLDRAVSAIQKMLLFSLEKRGLTS